MWKWGRRTGCRIYPGWPRFRRHGVGQLTESIQCSRLKRIPEGILSGIRPQHPPSFSCCCPGLLSLSLQKLWVHTTVGAEKTPCDSGTYFWVWWRWCPCIFRAVSPPRDGIWRITWKRTPVGERGWRITADLAGKLSVVVARLVI